MQYPKSFTVFTFINECPEMDYEEEILLLKNTIIEQSKKINIMSKLLDKTKVKWKVFT